MDHFVKSLNEALMQWKRLDNLTCLVML